MKRRKGEIATLLMIGAVVVMGITAVISSLTQNNTQSTSSRASINESCAVGETKCGTSSSFTCCNNATQTCNYTTHICMPKSTPIPTIPAGNPTCVKTSCSTVDPTFKKGYYQYNEVADKSYKTGCSGTALSANALWSYCQSLNPPPTVPPTVNTPTVVPTIGGGGPPTGGWTQSCCFVYPDGPQNDRYGCDPGVKYIRVYATAAARNANQMDTPCEKTVGYGAERFFECSQTSDACETPHAEPTTPLGNNTGGTCEVGGLSIPNDGKVHCLPDESNRYARCNGSIFTCSLGKSCNEGVGPNGDAQCSVIGVMGGVGTPVPTIPHGVTQTPIPTLRQNNNQVTPTTSPISSEWLNRRCYEKKSNTCITGYLNEIEQNGIAYCCATNIPTQDPTANLYAGIGPVYTYYNCTYHYANPANIGGCLKYCGGLSKCLVPNLGFSNSHDLYCCKSKQF